MIYIRNSLLNMANIFVTKYDRLLNAIIENMITGICDCVLCMCVDG